MSDTSIRPGPEDRDAHVAAYTPVEALRMIAEQGECSRNMYGNCVGAVHSRRKRYDNPERIEVVGCSKHFAEKVLAEIGEMPDRTPSAAKGWVCPVDGTTAPHLGDEHAVACPKCGRKMVRRV